MSGTPLTDVEQRELRVYFEGWRDVRLAGIKHGVVTGGGMSVFENIAGFIDGMALLWSSGKGGGKGSWPAFVREFFPPSYADLATLYDRYRNKTLHNGSAKDVAFTRGPDDADFHLTKSVDGAVILHLESLAHDTELVFYAFNERVFADPDVGRRTLKWFRERPPLRAVNTLSSAGAQSLSAASTVTTVELSRVEPGPLTLPTTSAAKPLFAPSIKQRRKKPRVRRAPKRFGQNKKRH